jgi:hypothetical protein
MEQHNRTGAYKVIPKTIVFRVEDMEKLIEPLITAKIRQLSQIRQSVNGLNKEEAGGGGKVPKAGVLIQSAKKEYIIRRQYHNGDSAARGEKK